MNVLIILIFSTLHAANIREISEIAKGFLVFNTSGSPTDLALLPAGQWVRRTNLPSAADFQFTDEHRFLCGLGGLEFERVTQISQMTQIFFDLFGQIHTDYLRTYAVTLVGDRNLRDWLRVLTQQSCNCLSPSGRLYSGCSCRYFSIQGFNSGISHSIVSQSLSGSTV